MTTAPDSTFDELDEDIVIIDPLMLKNRKKPWHEKRFHFRRAGSPARPHSSNGRQFFQKHRNRQARRMPIFDRHYQEIIPVIKKTIKYDLS